MYVVIARRRTLLAGCPGDSVNKGRTREGEHRTACHGEKEKEQWPRHQLQCRDGVELLCGGRPGQRPKAAPAAPCIQYTDVTAASFRIRKGVRETPLKVRDVSSTGNCVYEICSFKEIRAPF